jgi:SAM-dependent methyltransferase
LGDDAPVEMDDDAFDALLSEHARRASDTYWTPAPVARRAAAWIAEANATRVLDVGSGAGKFCLLAALASPSLRVTGVEQRVHFVTEAARLARELGIADRVDFVHGTLPDVEAARFDALYLYNPFSEHLFPTEARLDASVELSAERMARDVRALERVLDAMAVGAVLVTYHGFRGAIPDTFDLVRWEEIGDCMLRAWVKQRVRRAGFRWIEVDEGLTLAPGEID